MELATKADARKANAMDYKIAEAHGEGDGLIINGRRSSRLSGTGG